MARFSKAWNGTRTLKTDTMKTAVRFLLALLVLSLSALHAATADSPPVAPDRQKVLETMKRATTFMTEKVAYRGGYVWTYLPDMSRRWGEMEARETMIWLQPPGTSSMGHVFLDAYHATGDEYYYRAAEQVAAALIWGQHPSGGWNYVVDFGGDRSLRDWYATIGRNAWRLEEFQHYYGNATFDDEVTADAAKFLLRLYVEKHDPRYKPALDKAIQFVLDSQYPIGGWPQRYPLSEEFSKNGHPDYTSYLTFNDDVSAQNVYFLILCYEALGDERLLDPITRGMNFFLSAQQGPPQPGWGLQYTLDMRPAGARSYEPNSLATHTTATNVGHMIRFYELTGDSKFLARVPEALDWLESLRLPKAPNDKDPRILVPTFIELGTNKPLYVHRRGSNVFNGEYYVDYDSRRTIGHYSPTRRIDIAGLRKRYEEAKARSPQELAKQSPLFPGPGALELPRQFATIYEPVPEGDIQQLAAASLSSLNAEGYWPAPLVMTSHPYKGDGSKQVAKGDFASTHVGDETDTSPFPDPNPVMGISTAEYMKHMNVLIQWLETAR
jgi:PelA/Pel-15E family pectate lyase